MSCCSVPAGSLSALLNKFPKCADAGSTQQHPGSSFPSLPCEVIDHIPAAAKMKHWSLSPVAQTYQGLSKCEPLCPEHGICHVPPFPPPIHVPLPLTATPASLEGEGKSPRCISANKPALLTLFKETNQA